MFNKKNYKKVIITVLALTMILGTVALAAEGIYEKNLTATFGKIKFDYEGSDVTSQIESKYGTPAFISDGRAYAPIKAMGDLLNVDIDYDGTTHTVKITDPKVEEHKKQLDEKDLEISNKEKTITEKNKEIEELKKEIKKLKEGPTVVEGKSDLKSLEKSLNQQYGYFRDVQFDISLSGSTNKISMVITTDFMGAKNEYNWARISSTDRKYMVEDMVNQVRKDFPQADVTGYFYDSYNDRSLYHFSQTVNGSLSTSNWGSTGGNISDGRYDSSYVNSRVRSEFDSKGIYDAWSRLSYNGRTSSIDIEFSNTYSTQWDRLGNNEIESMLNYISSGVGYDYYYDDYYYDYDYRYDYDYGYGYGYRDDVQIEVYMGSTRVGSYYRNYYQSTGTFTRR